MKIYTQTGRLLFLHANGYQTCYDACEHVAGACLCMALLPLELMYGFPSRPAVTVAASFNTQVRP